MKEKAYAKINLFLNIVGKRFDGYHDLEMVMAPLELHDTLTFKKNKTGEIVVTTSEHITDNQEENIVFRVAKLLQEEFNINKGVHIHIEKNIPVAAGLAGGSADAAATFRGLNRLWKLNLSREDMSKLGENIGADIPFCIHNRLCIAKGKGEQLYFLEEQVKGHVLLVNPGIHVNTGEVFSKVTEELINERKISNMTNAIYSNDYELIIKELYNVLEQITFESVPEVREIKNYLIDNGVRGVLMSGSGATVFALSRNKKKLENIQASLEEKHRTILTKIR